MERMASVRMEVNSHRVARSRIDNHSASVLALWMPYVLRRVNDAIMLSVYN